MFHPAYFTTVFDVHGFTGPWPERFVILTAFATTGETWTAAENERADEALAAELIRRRAWFVRCTGLSPDNAHREPGWAAELEKPDACQLGRMFRQDAIYLVRSMRLEVCSCADPDRVALVGNFEDRVLRD